MRASMRHSRSFALAFSVATRALLCAKMPACPSTMTGIGVFIGVPFGKEGKLRSGFAPSPCVCEWLAPAPG